MKTRHNGINSRKVLALVVGISLAGCAWVLVDEASLIGQPKTLPLSTQVSPIFSPAHRTLGTAVRHFFMLRSDPEQPLPYTHRAHIELAGLDCVDCHNGVETGPVAHIPSVALCMDCHEFIATESPAIQILTAYYERNEEPPWQRVYGWNEEAHVRFNHAPHIRAGVECAVCHGNVAQMTVAERVVDHTMGFCINCHEQEQASNDCLVCHY